MIRVSRRDLQETEYNHFYSLAGHVLAVSEAVESLSEYVTDEEPELGLTAAGMEFELYEQFGAIELSGLSQPRYQGSAPFAGIERQVSLWEKDGLLRLDIDGSPTCIIDSRQYYIYFFNDQPFDEQLNLEVLTGPALLMLMAQKGAFCLHSGAVRTPFGNIVFIAESGVGKSTLTADAGREWQQLADDIVPVSLGDKHDLDQNSVSLLPFPQLKLRANRPVQGLPSGKTRVDLIIRIVASETQDVIFNELEPQERLIEVVKHTVAAKLFDQATLAKHLKFAQFMSKHVPIVSVSYPRNMGELENLRTQISDYLSGLDTKH